MLGEYNEVMNPIVEYEGVMAGSHEAWPDEDLPATIERLDSFQLCLSGVTGTCMFGVNCCWLTSTEDYGADMNPRVFLHLPLPAAAVEGFLNNLQGLGFKVSESLGTLGSYDEGRVIDNTNRGSTHLFELAHHATDTTLEPILPSIGGTTTDDDLGVVSLNELVVEPVTPMDFLFRGFTVPFRGTVEAGVAEDDLIEDVQTLQPLPEESPAWPNEWT